MFIIPGIRRVEECLRSPTAVKAARQRTAKRLGLYREDEPPRMEEEEMAGAVPVHFLLMGKGVVLVLIAMMRRFVPNCWCLGLSGSGRSNLLQILSASLLDSPGVAKSSR